MVWPEYLAAGGQLAPNSRGSLSDLSLPTVWCSDAIDYGFFPLEDGTLVKRYDSSRQTQVVKNVN